MPEEFLYGAPVGIIKDIRNAAGTVPDLADRLDDIDYRADRAVRQTATAALVVAGIALVLLAAIAVGVNRNRNA